MRVADDIARLETLTLADLRHRWVKLTGQAAPKVGTNMLRLALAWEIQASVHGGLPRATGQALDQLACGATKTEAPRVGMRLVREWGGRVHVVVVAEDGGVLWEERRYRSLSEVARAITGTRWSGPAFFGLKRKAAA